MAFVGAHGVSASEVIPGSSGMNAKVASVSCVSCVPITPYVVPPAAISTAISRMGAHGALACPQSSATCRGMRSAVRVVKLPAIPLVNPRIAPRVLVCRSAMVTAADAVMVTRPAAFIAKVMVSERLAVDSADAIAALSTASRSDAAGESSTRYVPLATVTFTGLVPDAKVIARSVPPLVHANGAASIADGCS